MGKVAGRTRREESLISEEMYQMRINGSTFVEIGRKFGITDAAAGERFRRWEVNRLRQKHWPQGKKHGT